MEIQTIKNGSTKLIAYTDGGDNRILQSTEMPAPEWNHAWENLALREAGKDYVMNKRGEVDMFEQDAPEETAATTEEG